MPDYQHVSCIKPVDRYVTVHRCMLTQFNCLKYFTADFLLQLEFTVGLATFLRRNLSYDPYQCMLNTHGSICHGV